MPRRVRPIPKGHHTVTPSVSVRGGDAFITFCKKAFGAKVQMRMPGPNGTVAHAALLIGDSLLSLNDEAPA